MISYFVSNRYYFTETVLLNRDVRKSRNMPMEWGFLSRGHDWEKLKFLFIPFSEGQTC